MLLGVERLLPFDCQNTHEFWAKLMDTHFDANEYSLEQELLPKFFIILAGKINLLSNLLV